MNYKNFRQKLNTSTKGFTLVEVIVVCVIMAILLSVGGGILVNYQKNSIYKRNCDYAESLFVSAQSAMTQYKVSGMLEKLNAQLTDANKMEPGIVDAADEARLRHIDLTSSEYENGTYVNSPVYKLLNEYVYDKSIFNAAIRLEFNPSDGTVYSVSYCDRVERLDGSIAISASTDEVVGVAGRDGADWEEQRREHHLGYYEAGLVEEVPEPVAGSIAGVRFYNEERLELRWIDSKYDSATVYTIELTQDDKTAVITVDADDMFSTESNTAECAVAIGTQAPVTMKFPMYTYHKISDTEREMAIVLDAIDLKAGEIALKTPSNMTTTDEERITRYQGTTSIQRFGFSNTEPVQASISATGAEGESLAVHAAAPVHPLMGEDSSGYNFDIKTMRHFYNLRFIEGTTDGEIHYTQNADLMWGGENGVLAAKKVYAETAQVTDTTVAYPSVLKLNEKSKLHSKRTGDAEDADRYAIENIILKDTYAKVVTAPEGQSVPATGLFFENKGKIDGLYLVKPTVDIVTDHVTQAMTGTEDEIRQTKWQAGAVCAVNKGEIKNVDIEDASIKGFTEVGTVCARNEGKLDWITLNATQEGALTVEGQMFVGGIVGRDMTEILPEEKTYEGLKVTGLEIKGKTYVGGMFGRVSGVTIDHPEFTGTVATGGTILVPGEKPEDTLDASCLGGIAGVAHEVIFNACKIKLENEIDLQKKFAEQYHGQFFGGVTGILMGGAIKNTTTEGYLMGEAYVGGMTGLMANAMRPESPEHVKVIYDGASSENKIDVIGVRYIGGIAGATYAVKSFDEEKKELIFKEYTENEKKDHVTLYGWKNSGAVQTMERKPYEELTEAEKKEAAAYAGGIVGYNGGIVLNSDSKQNTREAGFLRTHYNPTYSYGYGTGGIAGYNDKNATLEECDVTDNDVVGGDYTGGIVGENHGTVYKCDVKITTGQNAILIDGDSNVDVMSEEGKEEGIAVGGLIGYNAPEGILRDCTVSNAEVRGSSEVGGLIGHNKGRIQLQYGNNIPYLVLETNITVNAEKMAGGIAGVQNYSAAAAENPESNVVENSNPNGGMIWSKANVNALETAGGIFGSFRNGKLKDAYSDAVVNADKEIGGVVGVIERADGNVVIDDVMNRKTLSGQMDVGGIVGSFKAGNADIINSVNTGKIGVEATGTEQPESGAGILGSQKGGSLRILRCRNYGKAVNAETQVFSGVLGEKTAGLKPAQTVIQGCYGVAYVDYPVTKYTAVNNEIAPQKTASECNYYFSLQADVAVDKGEGVALIIKKITWDPATWDAQAEDGSAKVTGMTINPLATKNNPEQVYSAIDELILTAEYTDVLVQDAPIIFDDPMEIEPGGPELPPETEETESELPPETEETESELLPETETPDETELPVTPPDETEQPVETDPDTGNDIIDIGI